MLSQRASQLLAKSADDAKQLDEQVKQLNVSKSTQDKLLKDKIDALEKAQLANDNAAMSNIELEKKGKSSKMR